MLAHSWAGRRRDAALMRSMASSWIPGHFMFRDSVRLPLKEGIDLAQMLTSSSPARTGVEENTESSMCTHAEAIASAAYSATTYP